MPRKAKRKDPPGPRAQGGYGAQPIQAPTGLPYGEHQALVEAQQQVPLPAGPGMVESPGMPVPDPFSAAMSAGQAMRPPDPILYGPSTRPREPVTAGLPVGPGPGLEALAIPRGDRVARMMDQLAADSGDPAVQKLAELAKFRSR